MSEKFEFIHGGEQRPTTVHGGARGGGSTTSSRPTVTSASSTTTSELVVALASTGKAARVTSATSRAPTGPSPQAHGSGAVSAASTSPAPAAGGAAWCVRPPVQTTLAASSERVAEPSGCTGRHASCTASAPDPGGVDLVRPAAPSDSKVTMMGALGGGVTGSCPNATTLAPGGIGIEGPGPVLLPAA